MHGRVLFGRETSELEPQMPAEKISGTRRPIQLPALTATTTVWVIFSVAVLLGVKQFSLWSQVVDLQGTNPLYLYQGLHPHFLRYLLVYPVFEASALAGFAPDTVFSGVCLVALFIVFLAVRHIDQNLSQDDSTLACVFWSISLCGIAILMNGRGILAFLGYAMLLFSLVPLPDDRHPRWWLFISLPIAMLFCSVSSGVLFVAFAQLFTTCVICVLRQREMRSASNTPLVLAAGALTTVLFWNFLAVGLHKNLTYYGGGVEAIWTMLNHGAGRIIAMADPLILLPAALVLFAASLLAVWAARAFSLPVVICGASVLLALAGGVFGFTTLSVGFVPALGMVRLLFVRPSKTVLRPTRSYDPSTTVRLRQARELQR